MLGSSRLLQGCALAAIASMGVVATANAADVVIGNWENATDGWVDWSSSQAPITTPKFSYTTTGVTLGSSALQLVQSGWNQNLAIKLQDSAAHADYRSAFLSHNAFSIDVTVPADAAATSGWEQIYALTINADGYGWHDQNPVPKVSWGFPNGSMQTATVTWDYSAILPSIAASPTYIELILTTNNDGTHTTFNFDNARFTTVPEPASLGLLGLGAVGVLARRRRA